MVCAAVSPGSRWLAAFVLALWMSGLAPARAEPPGGRSEEAARLVFLLQYVGSDYAGAVAGGRILDAQEYREMNEFAALAEKRYDGLRAAMDAATAARLGAAFASLTSAVATRSDAAVVRRATDAIISTLVQVFSLKAAPRASPSPERAAPLYRENCQPCHGEHGNGDGPRARELDPRPASFRDAARMDSVAPYVFYNAITFGVPNTAMASFEESLGDQQRWDLAFYLWTFFAPLVPDPLADRLQVPLVELSRRASSELVPEVVRQARALGLPVTEEQAKAAIADLRARPRPSNHPAERLERMRQALARSLEQAARGDFDGAVDSVTTAYLADFEPLEPELDRRDPGVRRRFESGLIELRAAFRAKDRDGAAKVAGELDATVGDAGRALEPGTVRLGPARLLAVFAALLVVGALLLVAGRRRSRGIGTAADGR